MFQPYTRFWPGFVGDLFTPEVGGLNVMRHHIWLQLDLWNAGNVHLSFFRHISFLGKRKGDFILSSWIRISCSVHQQPPGGTHEQSRTGPDRLNQPSFWLIGAWVWVAEVARSENDVLVLDRWSWKRCEELCLRISEQQKEFAVINVNGPLI